MAVNSFDTAHNICAVFAHSDIILFDFYARWCRYRSVAWPDTMPDVLDPGYLHEVRKAHSETRTLLNVERISDAVFVLDAGLGNDDVAVLRLFDKPNPGRWYLTGFMRNSDFSRPPAEGNVCTLASLGAVARAAGGTNIDYSNSLIVTAGRLASLLRAKREREWKLTAWGEEEA